MDVGSNGSYPSNALSNFAAHEFVIDGVRCASMEGFLQSLKFSNPDMQVHICSLIGIAAKRAGREKAEEDGEKDKDAEIRLIFVRSV